jgi:hypothetical protein
MVLEDLGFDRPSDPSSDGHVVIVVTAVARLPSGGYHVLVAPLVRGRQSDDLEKAISSDYPWPLAGEFHLDLRR